MMLNQAEKIDSDNPKLFLYQGLYDFNNMEYAKAVEEYLKAAKKSSRSPDPYIRLSALYVNAKNPSYQDGEKAVEYAKKAVDKDPDSVVALDTLGQAYFFAGKYDLAIETENRALLKSPNNPILEANLARFQSTVKGSADDHNLKGAQTP